MNAFRVLWMHLESFWMHFESFNFHYNLSYTYCMFVSLVCLCYVLFSVKGKLGNATSICIIYCNGIWILWWWCSSFIYKPDLHIGYLLILVPWKLIFVQYCTSLYCFVCRQSARVMTIPASIASTSLGQQQAATLTAAETRQLTQSFTPTEVSTSEVVTDGHQNCIPHAVKEETVSQHGTDDHGDNSVAT